MADGRSIVSGAATSCERRREDHVDAVSLQESVRAHSRDALDAASTKAEGTRNRDAPGLALPYLAKLSALGRDLRDLWIDPKISVDLMYRAAAQNHPFYGDLVLRFYRDARRRHPKFPLIRRLSHGVALCVLPDSFDKYFMEIEGAARRNFKKAARQGFTFAPIDFNQHLEDIARIRRSAAIRQGQMSGDFLSRPVKAVTNPPSRSHLHGFPYFGIIRDGTLYAYAGCFLAGEVCAIEHIYGDAAAQPDGIVPMLIISIARYLLERHVAVKYYSYGTYYGARSEMRRFKRKFGYRPHRVVWQLDR